MANEIARPGQNDDSAGGEALGSPPFVAKPRLPFPAASAEGRAIGDFACLKHRVVIEVDGGQHNADGHARRDNARDARLNKAGYRVLRFWNSEVDGNLSGVLEAIDAVLSERPPPGGPADRHPPPSGEG